MPRHSAIFALVIFAAAAFADVVPTVQWDVETGRLTPVPYSLSIRRGESVNIQPRFLTYNSPMVLTGSTVQLRYWYTGQTGYYATTGSLMAATGRVHVAWYDALCPASNALNYEVRVTIGTNVLARGYGPLSLLTGSGGTETNGQVRTSINWSLIDQTGGMAVLSNQMGSGASWSGSAWVFGTADLSWSNNYYRASNPSNYAPASVTNGLYPSSNPSNYAPASVTNGLYPSSNPSNYAPASVTNGLLPAAATNGAEWGSHAGLATHAQATSAAQAVVSAWGAVTNVDALGPTSAVVVANGATAVDTDWVLSGVTFGGGILGRAGAGSGVGTLTNASAPVVGQIYRVIYAVVVSNGCGITVGYGGSSWSHTNDTVAAYTNVITAGADTKLQISITTDDDLSYAHGIRIEKLATATMDGTVDARRMMLGGTNLTSLFLQGITAAQIGAAGGLTNAAAFDAAGAAASITNGKASGTNMTGTIFVNGLANSIGTNSPWTQQGYVTSSVTNGLQGTNITAAQIASSGGLTNIVVDGNSGTVAGGVASVTVSKKSYSLVCTNSAPVAGIYTTVDAGSSYSFAGVLQCSANSTAFCLSINGNTNFAGCQSVLWYMTSSSTASFVTDVGLKLTNVNGLLGNNKAFVQGTIKLGLKGEVYYTSLVIKDDNEPGWGRQYQGVSTNYVTAITNIGIYTMSGNVISNTIFEIWRD